MDERAKEFLNKLADLMEEYQAVIGYTTDDDGIHIEVKGKEVFIGFDPTPDQLRAATAGSQ